MSATQTLSGGPLALSLGDPAGIGPEIIALAYSRRTEEALPPFFVVGGEQILRDAAAQRGVACPVIPINDPSEAAEAFTRGLPVMPFDDSLYCPGEPSEQGAALALYSLAEATRFALLGAASALVTAPVSKAQLVTVGFEYPGQTEFLAAACGMAPEDAVMMLAGPSLRAVPLTVHCALAEVPALLSSDLIAHKARIVAEALVQDFGLVRPRLAIAGLNPHAGEDGKFGREEADIIEPAIAVLQEEGLNVTGPVPGDALFTPRARKTYDVALAMYHDQALIPLKALEVDEGVNVTLGLPIIRTSPDHGTAFDIAGKVVADAGAMIASIRMASECVAARGQAAANNA